MTSDKIESEFWMVDKSTSDSFAYFYKKIKEENKNTTFVWSNKNWEDERLQIQSLVTKLECMDSFYLSI